MRGIEHRQVERQREVRRRMRQCLWGRPGKIAGLQRPVNMERMTCTASRDAFGAVAGHSRVRAARGEPCASRPRMFDRRRRGGLMCVTFEAIFDRLGERVIGTAAGGDRKMATLARRREMAWRMYEDGIEVQ